MVFHTMFLNTYLFTLILRKNRHICMGEKREEVASLPASVTENCPPLCVFFLRNKILRYAILYPIATRG